MKIIEQKRMYGLSHHAIDEAFMLTFTILTDDKEVWYSDFGNEIKIWDSQQ